LRGYQLAMRRAGLTPRVISPSVPLLNRRAVQFVCDQLQLPDRPTAIVCYGQNELQALVDAGYVLGIEVGRELKLSVFGEMPSPFAPEHEVVVLPEFSLGFTAARMLLNRVADPTRPQAPVAVPVRFTNPG
jgi:DNA-binding LacI/PurR family transcriptional regulator